MSLETRTYVITAESSILDELEKAFEGVKAQIGVKKHNPPRVEEIMKEVMEKQLDEMFKTEMQVYRAPNLPDNLDNTIPHF